MKFETSSLKWALTYISRGWPVLPVQSAQNREHCSGSAFRNQAAWPTQSTTDPATVVKWLLGAPFANVALLTGKASGIIAIRSTGDEGMGTLERWMDKYDWFPESSSIEQGATRTILYRASDLRVVSELQLGPGVVVIGDGGYILLPPSRDENGDCCTWDDPDDAIVEPPVWMAKLISGLFQAVAA